MMSRRRSAPLIVPIFLACFLAAASAGAAPQQINLDAIHAILSNKYFAKADVGIVIAQLADKPQDDRTLFKTSPDQRLIPASNLKLLTTSAFLDHFGGDFEFKTRLAPRPQRAFLSS